MLYLPSFSWCLACGWLLRRWTGRVLGTRALVVALLLLGLAARTWVRNADWRDSYTLFTKTVATSPGSARAHANFAAVHGAAGDLDFASDHFRAALEIYPEFGPALVGLAQVSDLRGARQDAIHWYSEAIRLDPANLEPYVRLGELLLQAGDARRAEEVYQAGLTRVPNHPLLLLGRCVFTGPARRPLPCERLPCARRSEPGSAAGHCPAGPGTSARYPGPLTRLPAGRALGDEGARPLGVVLALLDHLEVAGGDLLGLRDGEPEALEDAHLRAPHRERRVADHHGCELAGALHETRVRHHLGHEAHLVGALGAQALAAAEERHAEADGDRHAARHVHHLVRGDVAERDVRIDEGGLVRGDRDVRLGHQVEREAGHHAVHGRDHGLVHQLAARRGQLADAL